MTTAGSAIDTLLAVYTGTVVNGLTIVGAGNDDCPNAGTISCITFTATVGTVYNFQVCVKPLRFTAVAVAVAARKSGSTARTLFARAHPVANSARACLLSAACTNSDLCVACPCSRAACE